MSKKQSYFSIGSKLFWGLVLLVFVFVLLKLNPGIFKGDKIARDIIVEDSLSKINWEENIVQEDSTRYLIDTNKIVKDDYYYRTWSWYSLNKKKYILNFKILKKDYDNSVSVRNNSIPNLEKVWYNMYHHDGPKLSEMINGFKILIRENKLDYKESLDLIVSSAQNFPYTWVLDNEPSCGAYLDAQTKIPDRNCVISEDPCGCCDYVKPNGVFSPIEYAINGKGDCDTKSLFAYTILKEMGLDVAMLRGMAGNDRRSMGGHAMLGVNISKPPLWFNSLYVKDINENKYYAWETTTQNKDLGEPCWPFWSSWSVVKL
jgi:hypothetical protein